MVYTLSEMAFRTAVRMGIKLSRPEEPKDIYDNLMRMGFGHVSELMVNAVTLLGPMDQERTLVGRRAKPGMGSVHYYTSGVDDTGIMYAEAYRTSVLVAQGYPEGRISVERADFRSSVVSEQRLRPPFYADGKPVVAEYPDFSALPENFHEGLEHAIEMLLKSAAPGNETGAIAISRS